MSRLIEDISKLTTIPEKTLLKLVEKSYYCISDSVEETILEQKNIVRIDISIGELLIELNSDNIRYKFIPNKELEEVVKETVINRQNLLHDTLETTLVTKITNTYKELL